MVKRFAIGALLIVMFSAPRSRPGSCVEVNDDIKKFKEPSKPLPHGIEDLLTDVPAKRSADDPPARLRPPLRGIAARSARARTRSSSSASTPTRTRWRSCRSRATSWSTSPDTACARSTRPTTSAARSSRSRPSASLLNIDINHVINVNFGGFRRAIDRLGCVYTDVDRRYFNDNSGPGDNYAVIDLKAGYQKLCGAAALDFVRFRHQDSDFVRAARQQAFLSEAKEQIGVGKLFSDRKELLRIFGRYTADRHREQQHGGDPRPHQARVRLVEVARHRDPVPGNRLQGQVVRRDRPRDAREDRRPVHRCPG